MKWIGSSLLLSLAFAMLPAVAGCNSVNVVRANMERTAQNQGRPQPAAWPAHPYAPQTAARPRDEFLSIPSTTDQPNDSVNDEALNDEPLDDPNDDVIQTGAQSQNATPRAPATAQPSGVISGRVVDSSGRPQPYVSLVAAPTRRVGGNRVETMSDPAGNFALRGLDSGQRYLILATATRSPVALIGRVSAVAPQQGITVGVSRPFTADRQAEPPVEEARRPTVDRSQSAPTQSPGRSLHADPFASGGRIGNPPPSTVSRSGAKETREQAAANNRLQSPWDMPAPPARKLTPPPASSSQARAAEPIRTPNNPGWKPAGSNIEPPKSSAPGFPMLDPTPPNSTNAGSKQPQANVSEPAADQDTAPNSPSREPIEVSADARPDRARVASSKANVPIEPAAPAHSNSQPRSPLYEHSMCQMDGRRLVDFQLNDVDGHPVSFSSINSRLVLVDFWASYCGPCLKAVPHLVNLQKRYGPQGLQVVGIACEEGNVADRAARIAKLRNLLHVSYPLLLDDGDDKFLVRDHFGVDRYPTLILLDKTGKVLWRNEGLDSADMSQLENLLKSQLNATANRYN